MEGEGAGLIVDIAHFKGAAAEGGMRMAKVSQCAVMGVKGGVGRNGVGCGAPGAIGEVDFGIVGEFRPEHGFAAAGVVSPPEAYFIAVVDHRRTEIGELEEGEESNEALFVVVGSAVEVVWVGGFRGVEIGAPVFIMA